MIKKFAKNLVRILKIFLSSEISRNEQEIFEKFSRNVFENFLNKILKKQKYFLLRTYTVPLQFSFKILIRTKSWGMFFWSKHTKK